MRNSKTPDIVVIGAGPAGMMAAVTAAEQAKADGSEARVLLLERNTLTGVKLNITGKGRCNITNNSTPETVIKNTPRNGKFLYSCLNRFSPSQVMAFFEENGLPLKTERGNRVFPVSDRAKDVNEILRRMLKQRKVTILKGRALELITADGSISAVKTETDIIECKAVILATGGLSYPKTGSTGEGYRLACAHGHTLIEPRASIVPLESDDPACLKMQGLALKMSV